MGLCLPTPHPSEHVTRLAKLKKADVPAKLNGWPMARPGCPLSSRPKARKRKCRKKARRVPKPWGRTCRGAGSLPPRRGHAPRLQPRCFVCKDSCPDPHCHPSPPHGGGLAPLAGERQASELCICQSIRKCIEVRSGWCKTGGRTRLADYFGIERVDQRRKLMVTASNSVRMARIFSAMGPMASRQEQPTGLDEPLLSAQGRVKLQTSLLRAPIGRWCAQLNALSFNSLLVCCPADT